MCARGVHHTRMRTNHSGDLVLWYGVEQVKRVKDPIHNPRTAEVHRKAASSGELMGRRWCDKPCIQASEKMRKVLQALQKIRNVFLTDKLHLWPASGP